MIRFEDVTKIYEGQRRAALSELSVTIDKGEFVFLVGASGSGKSTFIRLVLREYRATQGRIFVAGKELSRLHGWKVPALRRQIGVVFQDFRLLPGKTVAENVSFALQVISLKALPVLILGGFTSVPGAIVGGLIIGIGEKLGEFYWGPLVGGGIESWLAYAIALAFLLFKPEGLFGEKIIERI